jgi:hypothetical protein
MKRCPRCLLEKEIEEFQKKNGGMGIYPFCVPCRKLYKQEQYQKHRDSTLKKVKQYTQENKERIDAYQKQYREEHRQELNEQAKEYRKENAEAIREQRHLYNIRPEVRQANRERHREKYQNDPEYRQKKKESTKRATRAWYQRNKQTVCEFIRNERRNNPEFSENIRKITRKSVKVWRDKHPERYQEIQRRRFIARKTGKALGFDGTSHYEKLGWWQQNRCFYCNTVFDSNKDRTVEHIVPVSRDGLHSEENTVLVCRYCNGSKNDSLLYREWIPKTQQISDYFLDVEDIPEQYKDTVRIVSTFMGSERNASDNPFWMKSFKSSFPDTLLFFDWEWKNRRSACLNLLQGKFGKGERIPARKTGIVSVSSEDARVFLEENHLQGFGFGALYLGLVHNDDLVGLSVWKNSEGVAELNRLAFKGSVQGGFGKMLSYFIDQELPSGMPVLSYVDPRYADGHSYGNFDFSYEGDTGNPLYYYANGTGIYHRRLFQKKEMKKRFGSFFDEKETERENAKVFGYFRVYGLPQKKFIFKGV